MLVLIPTTSAMSLADRFQSMLSQLFVEGAKQIAELTGGWHTKSQYCAIAEIDHLLCAAPCGVLDGFVDRLASHSIQERCFD